MPLEKLAPKRGIAILFWTIPLLFETIENASGRLKKSGPGAIRLML